MSILTLSSLAISYEFPVHVTSSVHTTTMDTGNLCSSPIVRKWFSITCLAISDGDPGGESNDQLAWTTFQYDRSMFM